MGRRLLVGLMTAGLTLAACGGGGDSGTTSTPTTATSTSTTTTATTTSTSTPTTTSSVAVTEDVLTVVGTIFGVEGYHQEIDGVWTGVETDLLEEIANRLGLTPEYVAAPFDEIIQGLADGRYDLAASRFSITPERQEIVAFTTAHLVDDVVLYTVKDGGVDDISDLLGGVVVVREGSSAESFMKNNHPDIGLVFSDPFTADAMVRSGAVDGRVTGDSDTDEYAKTVIGQQLTAFPADPAQQGLVDDINSALAAMIADGSYAEIYEKWFDTDDLRVDS